MIIDIKDLNVNLKNNVEISIVHSFSELENTGINKLDNVSINGYINSNLDLHLLVRGIMVLPCSVSLKPVNYEFEVEIDEHLEENLKNNQNTIDIFPIIWENILMEIPLRIVSDDLSDVKTSGEGWKLVDEKEKSINPELEKLKNLL